MTGAAIRKITFEGSGGLPSRKAADWLAIKMDAREYENLDRIEGQHWYYAGKRAFVRRWIERIGVPAADKVLLDCGAGTGRFAKEMEAYCHVMVLDDHEEALRMLRSRFREDQILSLAGDRVPLPDDSLDYITALDVLEHTPDDTAVVNGFHRLLHAGGIAVVTVPASMALWSDWDVGLHHFRRYSRPQLKSLFPSAEWELVHANYTNVLVYPLVWMVRRWRGWFAKGINSARVEDRIPPAWLNRVMRAQFVWLASWRIPFPFGVSLVLVARKR